MKVLSTFLSLLLTPLVALTPLYAETASVPGASTPAGQVSALQIRLADAGNAVVEASSSLNGYAIMVTDASGLPVSDAAVALRLPDDGATGFFTDGAHSAVAYTDATGVAKFSQLHWGPTLGSVAVRVTAVKGELHAGAIIEQSIVAHGAPHPISVPQAKAEAAKVTLPDPNDGTASNVSPKPGTPASVNSVHSGAAAADQAGTQTAVSAEPAVSVVNTPGVNTGGSRAGSSNKKWILLAVVAGAAAAGVAVALAAHGGAAAASSSTSSLSIGAPTVSVGH